MQEDKEVIISEDGGILCDDRNCQYRKQCANHSSAGDFREEGGFSPKLVFGESEKQVVCLSSHVKSELDGYDPKPIGHYEQGYVSHPIDRELGDLEEVECKCCSLESRSYSNEFQILIDPKTKKLYKKCNTCRKIDPIS